MRLLAVLILGGLLGAFSAPRLAVAAETVLLDEGNTVLAIAKRGNARYCIVRLTPAAGGSPQGPEITIQSAPFNVQSRLSARLEIGIVPVAGAESTQVVVGDTRSWVDGSITIDLTRSRHPPLFSALLEDEDVHVTSLMAGGGYRSARFSGTALLQALSQMQQDCRVDAERLAALAPVFEARERALDVGPLDLQRVSWVLHARYNPTLEAPIIGEDLSDETRTMLRRFTGESGLAPSRYLDSKSLAVIERERFNPIRWDHRESRRFATVGNWYTYVENRAGKTRCVLESEARSIRGGLVWRYPHIRIFVFATDGEGVFGINLAKPNPFNLGAGGGAVNIDGTVWTLKENGDVVLPVRSDGSFAVKFLRALKRGRSVTMTAPEALTGDPLTLTFSAVGFTAGFNRLMRDCGRGDMRVWLR